MLEACGSECSFFVLSITNKTWKVSKTGYYLFGIIPAITLILVLTNNSHHWIWSNAWLILYGKSAVMAYARGVGFWVFVIFSYSLLFLTTVVLLHSLKSARGIFRRQLITLFIGVMFPFAFNILYLFGIESLKYFDLTPVSFTIPELLFPGDCSGIRC